MADVVQLQHFFSNSSSRSWQRVLEQYESVLQKKAALKAKPSAAKELLQLDKWYHKDLPDLISRRDPPHMVHDELVQLMKWKLSRGTFRPSLMNLVKSNTPKSVQTISRMGFKKLPDLEKALDHLTNLKAVGPATASAILAAVAPEDAPYMADEALMAVGLTDLLYTKADYLELITKVKNCIRRLNEQDENFVWTAHKVDLVLWTYYNGIQLDSDMFREETAPDDQPIMSNGNHTADNSSMNELHQDTDKLEEGGDNEDIDKENSSHSNSDCGGNEGEEGRKRKVDIDASLEDSLAKRSKV